MRRSWVGRFGLVCMAVAALALPVGRASATSTLKVDVKGVYGGPVYDWRDYPQCNIDGLQNHYSCGSWTHEGPATMPDGTQGTFHLDDYCYKSYGYNVCTAIVQLDDAAGNSLTGSFDPKWAGNVGNYTGKGAIDEGTGAYAGATGTVQLMANAVGVKNVGGVRQPLIVEGTLTFVLN